VVHGLGVIRQTPAFHKEVMTFGARLRPDVLRLNPFRQRNRPDIKAFPEKKKENCKNNPADSKPNSVFHA
jgi:hypothetical protein